MRVIALLTMLKELDYFIKYTIQKQRPVFVTVLREEMRINYPYEAIRELAMNLVMHRNYQTNAQAKFYEYSDRIEIDNPGNLYGKVNPDNFPNETDYRNPVIANAMKTLGYVNRFGRGIEMVKEELVNNKNGLPKFDFADITTFKVVVKNADPKEESVGEVSEQNVGEKLTERQGGILNYIKQNDIITAKELATLLGVADRTIEREIQKLRILEVIERIDGDRGGYWKIIK